MTLESTTGMNKYVGNGVAKQFTFNFKVWKASQVQVFTGDGTTDQNVTSTCTITLTSTGGTVTFPNPPVDGAVIAIRRAMPFVQQDDYRNGSRFNSEEIEDRFDQDCAERQDLLVDAVRAVKVPLSSTKSAEAYAADFWSSFAESVAARDAARGAADHVDAVNASFVSMAAGWKRDLESLLQELASRGAQGGNNTLVTAAGSTSPRNLENRFGDELSIKDFGSVCDGETNDSLAVAAAEDAVSEINMDGATCLVDSIPKLHVKDTGFWKIDNFYQGLSVLVPASAKTLPKAKTVLNDQINSTSWAQDSAWYWNGRKCVGYSFGEHGTGAFYVDRGKSNANWMSIHQYGTKSSWDAPLPFFAPTHTESPNGWWHEGGCCIDGVEFSIMRRQSAGGSYPIEHKLFRRNLNQWHEGINIVYARSGTKYARVYKSDIIIGAMESSNSYVYVTTTSAVGGVTLTQEKGYVNVNNDLFIEITFPNLATDFSSTGKAGGQTFISVIESPWQEVSFSNSSFGDKVVALLDIDNQTYVTEFLGICPIHGNLFGAAYVSFGAPLGYVRLDKLLCNATDEATVEIAGIIPEDVRSYGYGEPSIAVSKHNPNIVLSMLRNAGTVPPGLLVYSEGITSESTPVFTQMDTQTGMYASGSYNPILIVDDVNNVEHVFSFVVDRAVPASEVKAGYAKCKCYLLHALLSEVVSVGITAFKWYYLDDLDYFDFFYDTGEVSRSQLGVGSMIDLEDGTIEVFSGEFLPHSTPDTPRANLVSYIIDVSIFTKHIVNYVQPSAVSQGTKLFLEYTGTLIEIPGGEYIKTVRRSLATYPGGVYIVRNRDTVDGSPDGIFYPPIDGFYKLTISLQIDAAESASFIGIWDVNSNAWYAPERREICEISSASNDPYKLLSDAVRDKGPAYDSVTLYLRAGQKVALKTSGLKVNQTIKGNMIRWELV